MTTRLTRRQVLSWLLGGAALVIAAFQVPVTFASRRRALEQRERTSVHIPTRPFDREELYRKHDLAG